MNGIGGELSDGEKGSVDGKRRNDRVHAGAVGEAGVDHRRRFVDAASDLRHDLVDHSPHVFAVDEARRDLDDLASALDEDDVRTVDHDLGDALVVEELLDRAVADDVVAHVLGELLEQRTVERRRRSPRTRRRSPRCRRCSSSFWSTRVVVQHRTELADDLAVHRDVHLGREPVALGRRWRRRLGAHRGSRALVFDLVRIRLLERDRSAVLLRRVEDPLAQQAHDARPGDSFTILGGCAPGTPSASASLAVGRPP